MIQLSPPSVNEPSARSEVTLRRQIPSVSCRGNPERSPAASRIQASWTATTRATSASESGRPAGMPCHLARHPRQQVAVACCATNTGWPRIGVWRPSLRGAAGARRSRTILSACAAMVSHPHHATYARSPSESRNRDRNRERASLSRSALHSPVISSPSKAFSSTVFPINRTVRKFRIPFFVVLPFLRRFPSLRRAFADGPAVQPRSGAAFPGTPWPWPPPDP